MIKSKSRNTADAQEPRELRPPSVQGDQYEEADDGDRGLEGLGAADVACKLGNVVVEVPVLVEAWRRGQKPPQKRIAQSQDPPTRSAYATLYYLYKS